MPNTRSYKRQLTGHVFGRLKVIALTTPWIMPGGLMKRRWICMCSCGNQIVTQQNHLVSGRTKSCGCLQKEIVAEMFHRANPAALHPLCKRPHKSKIINPPAAPNQESQMFEGPGSTPATNDANLVPGKGKKKAKGTGKTEKIKKAPKQPIDVEGRKDNEGNEATIDLDVLRKRVKDGEQLYLKSQDAKVAFADWNKATAQASGLMATVVSKFIKARCQGKVPDRKREFGQMELVFSEIGA